MPVPLAETFDYLGPSDDLPALGSRVLVPFGRSERVGIVVEHRGTSTLPPDKLKAIRQVLDAAPTIGAELLKTLRWAADYYHHPLGAVLSHALPGLLREGRPIDEPPEPTWRLTALGRDQSLERLGRSARVQARALAALGSGERSTSELRDRDVTAATLGRLAAKGWIEPGPLRAAAAAAGMVPISPGLPELTPDQRGVLDSVAADDRAGDGFRSYLLHGVTGSGKTEVYLRLIAAALAADRQTLLLVPEIGLTPQLVGRLRERFGGELAILHSALTERERFAAWRRAYRQEAKLIVGTRSAVFAPLPAAGLIIVDEEHDPSYKQQRGFRYSARDLAVVRAQRLNVPVVLGSATPSLETFLNAQLGRYRKLDLPRRIGAAGAPQLRVVDLNRHASRQSLSTPLVAAIEHHLAAGNQVLLFLNRRGFAPTLFCPGCKDVEQCQRCDARMTVHAKVGRAALPPLRRGAPLDVVLPALRQRAGRGGRRHAARRRRARGALPQCADRAPGSRQHEPQRRARRGAPRGRRRRRADSRRHANADEGTRLPARHARRRAECGSGPVRHRSALSRATRADDPASRRPCGARRPAGGGRDPDALSRPSAAALPAHARLRRVRDAGPGRAARDPLAPVLASRPVARRSHAPRARPSRFSSACAPRPQARAPTAASRCSAPRRRRWNARTAGTARSSCFAASNELRCIDSSSECWSRSAARPRRAARGGTSTSIRSKSSERPRGSRIE